MTRRNFLSLCAAGLLFPLLPGCGGDKSAEVRDLVPVGGTVTLDGKPVAGVLVIFSPRGDVEKGISRTGATGLTDSDGKYTLKHRSGEVGIAPGVYNVTFSKVAMPDGSPIPEGKLIGDGGSAETLPKRYTVVDETVKAKNVTTVKKEGGTFDFELKSK